MSKKLRMMIYTALMTAFVFIMTSIIKIPVPFTNGYIHAGDTFIFLAGILLGPWYGAFAAGVGSAMADFFGGYPHWVLPTLLIKAIMGWLIGFFSSESQHQKKVLLVTMATWFSVMIAFVFIIRTASIDHLIEALEEASSAKAFEMASQVQVQLVFIAIGLPALATVLFKFKAKYGLTFNQLVGMIIAGIWMVLGYFVAGTIMYGSLIASIFSVPWNIVQFGLGAILAFMVNAALAKAHITHHRLHS